ncbi:hypothetical protein [Hallella sp.]|uniref:hypothetical protein n=1 Tax=Hallella sp. TaxID=2980186 RepID=UPI00307A00C5
MMITEEGYDLPLKVLLQRLAVGRTFMMPLLKNRFRYIRLSPGFAGRERGWLADAVDVNLVRGFFEAFILREDVEDWLQKNWIYTQQEIGYYYTGQNRYARYGWIDMQILEELGLPNLNVDEMHRRECIHQRIEPPAPILSCTTHHAKQYQSAELGYRDAYRHGWIRAKYRMHKTIFLAPNTSNSKDTSIVPWTIPYGAVDETF